MFLWKVTLQQRWQVQAGVPCQDSAPTQETEEDTGDPPEPPALYKHCDARTPGEG